jgi:hypothetical protein
VSSPAVDVHQYWPFVILCALLLVSLVRLLLRERVALQTSIAFLTFLGLFSIAAVIPNHTARLAHAMGFTLLSNFLFCAAIIALAVLHLRALIALWRLEARTIQLIQDLAILQENLGRQTEANAVRTERNP